MKKHARTNALGTPENPITETDTQAELPMKYCKCSICAQVVQCTPSTDVYRCRDGKLRCTPCNKGYLAACTNPAINDLNGPPDPFMMN